MDTYTQNELAAALTREHVDFDYDFESNTIWIYTFSKLVADIAKKIALDFDLPFEMYLPIDRKNDKAGEYKIG
jgi:hypothetical protein